MAAAMGPPGGQMYSWFSGWILSELLCKSLTDWCHIDLKTGNIPVVPRA